MFCFTVQALHPELFGKFIYLQPSTNNSSFQITLLFESWKHCFETQFQPLFDSPEILFRKLWSITKQHCSHLQETPFIIPSICHPLPNQNLHPGFRHRLFLCFCNCVLLSFWKQRFDCLDRKKNHQQDLQRVFWFTQFQALLAQVNNWKLNHPLLRAFAFDSVQLLIQLINDYLLHETKVSPETTLLSSSLQAISACNPTFALPTL